MKHFISPLTLSVAFLSVLGITFFYGALQFASESGRDFVVILIFLLVTIAASSIISAYFWEKALVKRHKHAHMSLGSAVVVGGILFALFALVRINGAPLLLHFYILLGDFLRDNLGINIYYLDYHGFALLYLGISGILLAMALDFLFLKAFLSKRIKRK